MNTNQPKFWAAIGFGVGTVMAAAGSISAPSDVILGGLIQSAIWFGVSKFVISKKKTRSNILQVNNSQTPINSTIDSEIVKIKICETCEKRVPLEYSKCFFCNGTKLLNYQISASDYQLGLLEHAKPQSKICPMCAERIKFEAKKCRFCQHLMDG